MSNTTEKQVIELIKRSKKVLVMPSSPPDGDSIGSALALYISLKKLQKEVTVVCYDATPEVLSFLPNTQVIGGKMSSSKDFVITIDSKAHIESIKTEEDGNKINIIITPGEGSVSEEEIVFNKGKSDYDLIITVDCAELTQLGDLYENNIEMFHQVPVVNIDHHVSNAHFGKINYVDIMSSSTTELLFPILEQLGKEEGVELIDEDVATLLLTGIITDTGSFQNANTSPKSFAKAAQLISYGARQQEIIQHIYKTKQLSQLKLWGRVLTKIQTDDEHRMVWSVVSQQDFKDTESSEEQTGDIIDELMTNAPGAEIVFLMKEREDGTVSVSMRTTTPSVDASFIAEQFGGGGHTQAAGFRISDKKLRDAEYAVIKNVQEYQKDRLNIQIEEEEEKTPLINVEELMKRAKDAEMATKIMDKTETSPKEEESILNNTETKDSPILPKKSSKKAAKKVEKPKKESFNPKVPQETSPKTGYKFEA